MVRQAKKADKPSPVYTEEQLAWVDPCENIIAGDGFLMCKTCGSGIRVGGIVERDGVRKKRVYTPWKWWNEHRRCEERKG